MKQKSNTYKQLLKAHFCAGLLLLCGFSFAQNEELTNELEKQIKRGDLTKEEEVDILKKLATEATDSDKQLTYSLQLIVLAKELELPERVFDGYIQKGAAFEQKGELTKALESFFEASKIAIDNELQTEEAEIDIAIASVYSTMKDYDSSFEYYRKAIKVLEQTKDTVNLLTVQLNIGDEFYNIKKIDSAYYYATKANELNSYTNNEKSDWFKYHPFFQGYIDGLNGLIHIERREKKLAIQNLNLAIDALTEFGDYEAVSEYTGKLSDMYYNADEIDKALPLAKEGLRLARENGFKDEIGNSLNRLSKIYESRGSYKKAYEYYVEGDEYQDSVNNIADFSKLSNIGRREAVYESEREAELAKKAEDDQKKINNQQKIIIAIVGLGLIVIGFLAYRFLKQSKVLAKQKTIIEFEKQRSDDLLTNILPEETAEELKKHGAVKAQKFDMVSVLFTDFKGFTSQSELLNPEDLVKSIDYYFSKFDEIVEKFKLEKIKTIGDAYMCAGGIPFPIEHQAAKAVQAGLEMAEFVRQTKRNIDHKLAKFDIRIGIHTGPIVAGVVGTKKFQYDIWGDTVNTAARMESASEIGRVNVSRYTSELLKNYDIFKLTPRGAMEAKGKGAIEMFFVDYKD